MVVSIPGHLATTPAHASLNDRGRVASPGTVTVDGRERAARTDVDDARKLVSFVESVQFSTVADNRSGQPDLRRSGGRQCGPAAVSPSLIGAPIRVAV